MKIKKNTNKENGIDERRIKEKTENKKLNTKMK